MTGNETGLRPSGESLCDSLSTLLRNSVHKQMADGADELADTEVYEPFIRDTIEEHGFEMIGEGAGRIVCEVPSEYTFENRSIVVKFARPFFIEGSGDGLNQNMYEGSTWEAEKDGDVDEWLCPVLDSPEHNRYVTMPKCEVSAETNRRGEISSAVVNGVSDTKYEFELNEHNMGVMPNDNIVIIDYGIPNMNHGTDW